MFLKIRGAADLAGGKMTSCVCDEVMCITCYLSTTTAAAMSLLKRGGESGSLRDPPTIPAIPCGTASIAVLSYSGHVSIFRKLSVRHFLQMLTCSHSSFGCLESDLSYCIYCKLQLNTARITYFTSREPLYREGAIVYCLSAKIHTFRKSYLRGSPPPI